ncbi:MAG: ATP-dependent RecD-like DNA helicase [Clostridia bacterium]|nr:ATP-dependent RecD-like DNA helicase [Clostridia bacterium]
MQVAGEITNIIFRSEETGYTVIDLKCSGGETITAVGIFPPVSDGEMLVLEGEYKMKTKFGNQLVVEKVSVSAPTRLDSIKRFLASGLIKGLGSVTASAIVDMFGINSLQKMNLPFELHKVRGVSLKKATEFGLQYSKILNMQETVMFLQDLGLTINMALKIYKVFEEKTKDVVTKNPYVLIDSIERIGFATADKIAANIGISKGSDKRISAGITYLLKDSAQRQGNTYLPEDELISQAIQLLQLDDDEPDRRIRDNIGDMILLGQLKRIDTGEHIALMLIKNYIVEKSISAKLIELSRDTLNFVADADSEIKRFEDEVGIVLHKNQRQAVKDAIENGIAIVTGGPGTGKTTIVKCILHAFRNMKQRVTLCAPTGRAAKRLSEATGEDARTIHRMLDLEWGDGNGVFTYNEMKKLPLDVIIVDEVSMVDEYVFNALLRVLERGTRIVLVGDKDQLPSVGAGNILSDVIGCGQFSVSYLTQIYRQSEDSSIVVSAHAINNGEMPDLTNKSRDFFYEEKDNAEQIRDTVLSLCTQRLPEFLNISPKDIQLLSPMKRGYAGVENLNREMQKALNPFAYGKREMKFGDTVFREGDKVMQTVNNYKQEWTVEIDGHSERGVGVFNGDVGYIDSINMQIQQFTVRFDDDKVAIYAIASLEQLVLAYAVTIHKSQGSEFDTVVIALDANYMLLTRNLLYTAVTRAKNMVVIVGAKKTLKFMISNNQTAKRYSLLSYLINAESKKQEIFD